MLMAYSYLTLRVVTMLLVFLHELQKDSEYTLQESLVFSNRSCNPSFARVNNAMIVHFFRENVQYT